MIEVIKEIRKNHFLVEVDGEQKIVVAKDNQTPEEVLASLGDPQITYVDKRLAEYPSIQEQLDMIYHDIDGWRAKISEIKTKYPK